MRLSLETKPGLVERLAALAVVAGLARGDQVLPAVGATAVARHHVVERQVVGLAAAVLAGVPVAREDLATAELHARPRPADEVLETDHGGRAELRPRRPNHLVVVLDHLGLLTEQQSEGPWQIADVERLVVLVQNENDAVHGGRRITSHAASPIARVSRRDRVALPRVMGRGYASRPVARPV